LNLRIATINVAHDRGCRHLPDQLPRHHIEILKSLYARILIPPSVLQELQDSNSPAAVGAWISKPPLWLEVQPLTRPLEPSLRYLDRGEQEAISLALELPSALLIADDLLARAEASRRGLPLIGTLGVLRNAARADLLSLPTALLKLQSTSFFVAPALIESLLAEDAERLGSTEP
jgi:predicted nucleic acid-binding protein